jgi:hypothetical protein
VVDDLINTFAMVRLPGQSGMATDGTTHIRAGFSDISYMIPSDIFYRVTCNAHFFIQTDSL